MTNQELYNELKARGIVPISIEIKSLFIPHSVVTLLKGTRVVKQLITLSGKVVFYNDGRVAAAIF